MARKISPQREAEYNELKRVLLLLYAHWGNKKFSSSMENIMNHNEAKFGKSRALAGLKEAINETLDGLYAFTKDELAEIDRYLKSHHAPTLTELYARKGNHFAKILRRGRIKDDVEYYMLNERLNDVDDKSASPTERRKIAELVAQYGLAK
jgi:hypothetical protein